MVRSNFCKVAIILHLAACEMCYAESYAPFPPTIEFSPSRMVTAVVLPMPKNEDFHEQVNVSVFTRFNSSRPPGLGYKRAPASLHSGAVEAKAELQLKYTPSAVRVSDAHIALVDRYGVNRNWLRENPAIRISSLNDRKEIRIMIEDLVSDVAASVHVSDSSLGWFRDAWFSNDGTQFYVAIWKAKDADVRDALRAVNIIDGSVRIVDPSDTEDVFAMSESRFHATLFDLAVTRLTDLLMNLRDLPGKTSIFR